jgi:hypothetical protein
MDSDKDWRLTIDDIINYSHKNSLYFKDEVKYIIYNKIY